MKVLWLGHSEHVRETLAPEERLPAVLTRAIAAGTGEEVELVARRVWPAPNMPDLVDDWVTRVAPDVVVFKVTPFWYDYETVAQRLANRFGWLGRRLGRAGTTLTDHPPLARSRPVRLLQRAARAVVGREAPFPVDVVVERSMATIRRVAAHEGVLLVVTGSDGGRAYELDPQSRALALRAQVDAALRPFCGKLHVRYHARAHFTLAELATMTLADQTHFNAHGARVVGTEEGALVAEAWRAWAREAAGSARRV
ncbi:MAG: hypothetical protein IT304_04005 [Dehalococcoidia bacterium]|nr:hypothetical protein [Dehalococcoidia bacterium]